MSWAGNRDDVLFALALGVAAREFRDYIEQGIGTQEQIANVYLHYARQRPHVSIERIAQAMREDLDRWIANGGMAAARTRRLPTITELPIDSSSGT